jgi:hypothetical protein
MIDVLSGLLSIALIFFLPGFFLVLVIFPKRGALGADFDLLFKIALGIMLSLLISTLTGMLLYGVDQLSSASADVQSQRLWAILGSASIAFAAISWFRGGIQALVGREAPPAEKKEGGEEELIRLTSEKRVLLEKFDRLESESHQKNQSLREEAKIRKSAIRGDVDKINARIEELLREDGKKTDGGKTA